MTTNSGRMMPHWLDHVAIPTYDLHVYTDWAVTTLGGQRTKFYGISTAERQKNVPVHVFLLLHAGPTGTASHIGSHHIGVFLTPEIMPEMTKPLGKGTPR